MENNDILKTQQDSVKKFYMSTLAISNIIKVIQDDTLLNTSWSLGLTDLQKNLEWMENEMLSMQYSLDYKQATTFKSYLNIASYLVGKLKDDLVGKDEGMHTVKLIRGLVIQSFSPFSAFICKRVKELNVLPFIPEMYRELYYSYNDDFKESDNDYLAKLFELSYEDGETAEDYEVLEIEVEEYFEGRITMEDLNTMREIISEASRRSITENNLELDF